MIIASRRFVIVIGTTKEDNIWDIIVMRTVFIRITLLGIERRRLFQLKSLCDMTSIRK